MTSLWRIDCTGQIFPCTAKIYLNERKNYAEARSFNTKVSSFLEFLNTKEENVSRNVTYSMDNCLILSF